MSDKDLIVIAQFFREYLRRIRSDMESQEMGLLTEERFDDAAVSVEAAMYARAPRKEQWKLREFLMVVRECARKEMFVDLRERRSCE